MFQKLRPVVLVCALVVVPVVVGCAKRSVAEDDTPGATGKSAETKTDGRKTAAAVFREFKENGVAFRENHQGQPLRIVGRVKSVREERKNERGAVCVVLATTENGVGGVLLMYFDTAASGLGNIKRGDWAVIEGSYTGNVRVTDPEFGGCSLLGYGYQSEREAMNASFGK